MFSGLRPRGLSLLLPSSGLLVVFSPPMDNDAEEKRADTRNKANRDIELGAENETKQNGLYSLSVYCTSDAYN